MSEIVKIGKKAQMVIPKHIRKKLNLAEGQEVFIEVQGDIILIVPISKKIEELAGIGKGLYNKEYLEKIRDEW
jgi:AbrB family looped-hinge helix DNA binding protein